MAVAFGPWRALLNNSLILKESVPEIIQTKINNVYQ